ncbi:MAG: hypothetical protein ACLTAI_04285 [Thomasclavelia sp.]
MKLLLAKYAIISIKKVAFWKRVTTDDKFTMYRKPELDRTAPIVPSGDFIADRN